MKTSIATVSIPGALEEKISAISTAGFNAIELFEPDLENYSGTTRDVSRLVRDHGLEITLLQPLRDFEGRPVASRNAALDEAERKFDLMHELETSMLLVCSSVSPEASGDVGHIVEDFHTLAERAAQHGFRVGYEALSWGMHVRDVSQAWEIVERCNHPNFGLAIDSFHALWRNNDLALFQKIPGERIFDLQIADAPRLDLDTKQVSRQHRKLPGQGDLDVDALVKSVLSTGYAGPLCLEIFGATLATGSPTKLADDGYQSLVGLMKRVA